MVRVKLNPFRNGIAMHGFGREVVQLACRAEMNFAMALLGVLASLKRAVEFWECPHTRNQELLRLPMLIVLSATRLVLEHRCSRETRSRKRKLMPRSEAATPRFRRLSGWPKVGLRPWARRPKLCCSIGIPRKISFRRSASPGDPKSGEFGPDLTRLAPMLAAVVPKLITFRPELFEIKQYLTELGSSLVVPKPMLVDSGPMSFFGLRSER